jgi:hypothetical protein
MTTECAVCGWPLVARAISDLPWCLSCWRHLERSDCTPQHAEAMLATYWNTWRERQWRRELSDAAHA